MKQYILATFLVLSTADPLRADQDDPCVNYQRALAYARTSDVAIATLTLHEPETGAEIEMKLPRSFVGSYGNLTDGPQCQLAFELMWPQMTAGGLVTQDQKSTHERVMGDRPVPRSLTIDLMVKRQPWANWIVASKYCHHRATDRELGDRPYGLRALNDSFQWPSIRQSDGSYRNMRELLPYPLNEANLFYFPSEKSEEAVSISCSKGAPRCQLQGNFAGFQTTTFFNAEDIANWRTYRDTVRQFLSDHTVRRIPPITPVEIGRHTDRTGRLGVCMRELGTAVGADTLRQMGLD